VRAHRALLATLALLAVGLVTAVALAPAATSSVTVSMSVPSSVSLASNCTNPASYSLGTVLPGASALTSSSTPCSFTFQSSNDTSMLRVGQMDGAGTAMTQQNPNWTQRIASQPAFPIVVSRPDNAAKAVAFDPSGKPYTTTNSGATWVGQTTVAALSGVTIAAWVNGTDTVYALQNNQLYRSLDAGVTWAAIGATTGMLYATSMAAPSATTIYLGGLYGIYRTTNTGTSWTQIAGPFSAIYAQIRAPNTSTVYYITTGTVNKITAADTAPSVTSTSNFMATGGGGLAVAPNLTDVYAISGNAVWRSTDSGTTFAQVATKPGKGGLRAIQATANNAIYAVGNDGTVMYSTDGTTWSTVSMPTTNQLNYVSGTGATVYIAASGGKVFSTTTATTFVSNVAGGKEDWRDVTAVAPDTAWAVGSSGAISKSTDAGATFTPQTSNTAVHLEGVAAASDALHAVAVGKGGLIDYTANGGTTWTVVPSGTTADLWEVTYADATTVVAVGSGGTILRSNDAGATWSTVRTGAGQLYAVDAGNDVRAIWAGGTGGQLLKSVDGGATWSAQASGTTAEFQTISAVSPLVAYATTSTTGDEIRVTRDGGTTWTSSLTGYPVNGLAAADETNVVAIQEAASWRSTSDAGANWYYTSPRYTTQVAVTALDAHKFISVGRGGAVYTLAGLNAVNDYGGANTWSGAGANMFGVCLQNIGLSAAIGLWTKDASGTCTSADTDPWNAVPLSPVKVAQTSLAGQSGSADFVFGARTATNQPAGIYRATIVFEALAPAV
jgi:photosystem II stability/assembly factor-like uncharacterized protein